MLQFFLLKEMITEFKERLQEQAQNKYRELSNEEKDIERKFGRNQYSNMSSNYYYFCKLNIPVINLIVGSRNMIIASKNMSLWKIR